MTRHIDRGLFLLRRAAPVLAAAFLLPGLTPALTPVSKAPPGDRALLWQMGSPPRAYLLGTIHLPQPGLLREGGPVMLALSSADALITEIPLDPLTQARALVASMLPEGESLTERLPQALVDRLSRVLEARGLPLAAFDRLRPWALAAQLSLLDELPAMARTPPLDVALYRTAGVRQMRRGGLETLDEQIAAFERSGPEFGQEMLRQAIEELELAGERGSPSTAALRKAYASGDLGRLERLLDEQAPADSEFGRSFRSVLIDERNERMARRIASELAEHPDEVVFFAVGALHLGGDSGLLRLLEQRGLEPRRVEVPAAGYRLPAAGPSAPKELSP